MRVVLLMGAAALALTLSACGQKTSAVTGANGVSPSSPSAGISQAAGYDQRDASVPLVDGKPMWAANRKHSAQDNAQYQFAKNGGDFGARSESDYVAKVHAFIERPPSDVETLDRQNGDRLIYDAKANVFAVVSKDGAPRTMFKPRDGASYWAQQKDREAKRAAGAAGGSDQS
jgi:pyocin large subunit-like protein